MATNKQRREAERERLRRQLEDRRRREASRKRVVLVSSVVGTLALIVVLVIVLATTLGGDDDPKPAARSTSSTPAPTSSAPEAQKCTSAAGQPGVVSFQGVSVGNATTLTKEPKVCATSTKAPAKLLVKDLVVGKGKTSALTSTVSVQYTGVLYKDGTQFDSSWAKGGMPAQFSLQRVVPGFTQGIGGNAEIGVKPMKVGGRRIVIMPAALGYGAQGQPPTIPPNSPLVFVIDLKAVS